MCTSFSILSFLQNIDGLEVQLLTKPGRVYVLYSGLTGLLGYRMIRFRVKGILVIVWGFSYGPRNERLYIDVIGNLRLEVREVRVLSHGSQPQKGADVRARLSTYGKSMLIKCCPISCIVKSS